MNIIFHIYTRNIWDTQMKKTKQNTLHLISKIKCRTTHWSDLNKHFNILILELKIYWNTPYTYLIMTFIQFIEQLWPAVMNSYWTWITCNFIHLKTILNKVECQVLNILKTLFRVHHRILSKQITLQRWTN